MERLVFKKMYLFKLNIILLFLIFQANYCQRRITEGEDVVKHKRYMVYLLKAGLVSPKDYLGWVCGGALVNSEYIVTSAACVSDVVHLYAVAGYDKYVGETNMHTDPCTKVKKKKVVLICTPTDYVFDQSTPTKWAYIDIAVVKVESPYEFDETKDDSFTKVCSYTPAAININFEAKYQETGIDAIVLGWGHQQKFREDDVTDDLNTKELKYTPVLIANKEDCKKEYVSHPGMDTVIQKYMICTMEKGNLNDEGGQINVSLPKANGCDDPSAQRLFGKPPVCDNITTTKRPRATKPQRLLAKHGRKILASINLTANETEENINNSRRFNTRRGGICQNDHGGPLVTWVGAHEVLIGVASAFRVADDLDCLGPYLYTSTQCNGAFLHCIMTTRITSTDPIRRADCKNLLNETGYRLSETQVSWKNHPDGPAENEKNITSHASVTNTTNNITSNLNDTKDEENKINQVQNATILVTNTNYTTPILSIENSTLTITSKTFNVSDGTPINLTDVNFIDVTKSATDKLPQISVKFATDTLPTGTDRDIDPNNSSYRYHTENSEATKYYAFGEKDGTMTTVLMKTETNDSTLIKENLSTTTTVNPGKTETKTVNVTTSVNVKTTKTTHILLRSTAKEEETSTGNLLGHTKPTRTTLLELN